MSFDQLKREAATLERQLEEKLSRYQQLVQKINTTVNTSASTSSGTSLNLNDALSRAEQGGSAGGGGATQLSSLLEEESSLEPELQRLVSRLQDLISGRLASSASTASQQASVKRYREILLDLRSDLDKSRQSVRRARERHELLQSTSGSNISSNSNDPAMDHLLRERNHINNSMNAASAVIGQADAVRSDLYGQGRSLRGTSQLMQQLTTNIPGLNNLIHQIRQRRSRDDKIVAGVIASCIVFTLWYLVG